MSRLVSPQENATFSWVFSPPTNRTPAIPFDLSHFWLCFNTRHWRADRSGSVFAQSLERPHGICHNWRWSFLLLSFRPESLSHISGLSGLGWSERVPGMEGCGLQEPNLIWFFVIKGRSKKPKLSGWYKLVGKTARRSRESNLMCGVALPQTHLSSEPLASLDDSYLPNE